MQSRGLHTRTSVPLAHAQPTDLLRQTVLIVLTNRGASLHFTHPLDALVVELTRGALRLALWGCTPRRRALDLVEAQAQLARAVRLRVLVLIAGQRGLAHAHRLTPLERPTRLALDRHEALEVHVSAQTCS